MLEIETKKSENKEEEKKEQDEEEEDAPPDHDAAIRMASMRICCAYYEAEN